MMTRTSADSQRPTGISLASSSVTAELERPRSIDYEKAIATKVDSREEPVYRVVPSTIIATESIKSPSLECGTVSGAALDYSGAAKKTDPREIKLVKKLDWHIMVRIL